MKDLALALQRILRARLPMIDRWLNVNIEYPNEKWSSDSSQNYKDDGKHIIIRWFGNKSGKNAHPFELKQVALKDIPILIERNKQKLNRKTKVYK